MNSEAASLAMLGAGMSAWPAANTSQLRLRWLAQHRLGQAAPTAGSGVALLAGAHRRRVAWAALVGSWILASAWTGSFVPALLAAVVAGVSVRLCTALRSDRARRADRAALTGAVTALIDECAAGASLPAALRNAASVAGPHRDDFATAADTLAGGGEIADVWRGEAALASLTLACSLAAESGAAVGAALTAVRDELRADAAVDTAAAEILAGPVSSAFLLAFLPILGIGLGAMTGADPLRVLFHTTWGELALTLGVLLDLAGVLWTLRLARRAAP